mgnify:CR=1 FL=1
MGKRGKKSVLVVIITFYAKCLHHRMELTEKMRKIKENAV